MSKPPVNPEKTLAGIAVDPRTLDRVIPESRRPDGSVRKQIKIRPGFTPQEDVIRFRGTKQAQMDANALPKGHIIGWTPPPAADRSGAGPAALSKNAKKRQKQREKRAEAVKDNWEDDDEPLNKSSDTSAGPFVAKTDAASDSNKSSAGTHTPEKPVNRAASPTTSQDDGGLANKLEKLEVK